jgi:hypothetical protein
LFQIIGYGFIPNKAIPAIYLAGFHCVPTTLINAQVTQWNKRR